MSFVRQLAVSASRLAFGRHGQMLRGQEVWRRPRFLAGLAASPQPLIVSVRNRPVCQVTTNLTDEQVSKDFLKGLSKVIADTLVKPEQVETLMLMQDMGYETCLSRWTTLSFTHSISHSIYL